MIGKYIIIQDLKFSDYMKTVDNTIILYDTLEEAIDVCGIYEFPEAIICEIKFKHKELE